MKAKVSTYIVNPIYDWLFIIGSPVILFIVAVLISDTWIADGKMYPPMHNDENGRSYLQILMGTGLAAHFLITFLRSHANTEIFKLKDTFVQYRHRQLMVYLVR